MKAKRLSLLLFLFALSLRLFAESVSIYPIVFCNTLDKGIGKSCLNDKERFLREFGVIQAALDCDDVDWSNIYVGEDCSKENLEYVLSDVSCSNNDVIFFYYSGHGVRSENTADSEWLPQMCLKYKAYEESKFASAQKVLDALKAKNPRLIIFLLDCCNSKSDFVSEKSLLDEASDAVEIEVIDKEALKKLFYESRGIVKATSSKVGQKSICVDRGGIFSMAFWNAMYRVEQKQAGSDVSWRALMDDTTQRTVKDSSGRQTPICDVAINGAPNPTPPGPSPINIVVTTDDKDLKDALALLLDRSVPVLARIDRVKGVLGKFFTENAHATVVGRNNIVKFKPKPIADYLDELVLSKSVKGIILNGAEKVNGKYSNINVIEIR